MKKTFYQKICALMDDKKEGTKPNKNTKTVLKSQNSHKYLFGIFKNTA
jgi:hypothetical protein